MGSDSHIILRFLGAGGAFSRKYGTTCSLLTFPGGSRWLIDCGRQAPDQLLREGLSWHDIEGQIITHVHGDHVFGLEDFAFVRFYESSGGSPSVLSGGSRPRLVVHSAVRNELWETLAAALRYVPGNPLQPAAGTLDTYFEIIAPRHVEPPGANPWAEAEHFESGEVEVVARDTVHVPGKPATCLTLRAGEGQGATPLTAWWSGDSIVRPNVLIELEPKTSIFFHDCTFVEYPGQVHGSFREMAKLPKAVREKIVLMHHEDDIESHRAEAEALGFRIALPGHEYDLVTGQRVA